MSLGPNAPAKTLAAILVQQNAELAIAEIDLPATLAVGQVLVKLRYSGICGSQIGEIDGVKGPDPWLPHLLGHEGSGHVIAVGPGVTFVKPNDTVVLHWRPSQGIEATPAKYSWDGKTVNAGWVTTFNAYTVVAENRLTVISPDADLKAAALYGCAVTTGFGTIDNCAHLKLGETVVVFGSGGIGLNIVQGAALAGARVIVAVDRFGNRLDLARTCGATHTIDASKADAWAELKKLFPNGALDVFIDNTGVPAIIAQGYELVSKTGRVILVGVPRKGQNLELYTLPLHFGKSITGTAGGGCVPHRDIPRYMALNDQRGVDLNTLITEIAPLGQINTLIAKMRSGASSGRCLIDFSL